MFKDKRNWKSEDPAIDHQTNLRRQLEEYGLALVMGVSVYFLGGGGGVACRFVLAVVQRRRYGTTGRLLINLGFPSSAFSPDFARASPRQGERIAEEKGKGFYYYD
jgi:hypothetical protein